MVEEVFKFMAESEKVMEEHECCGILETVTAIIIKAKLFNFFSYKLEKIEMALMGLFGKSLLNLCQFCKMIRHVVMRKWRNTYKKHFKKHPQTLSYGFNYGHFVCVTCKNRTVQVVVEFVHMQQLLIF